MRADDIAAASVTIRDRGFALAIDARSHALRSRPEQALLVAVFFGYVAIVAFGAFVHEPWWDETQAWLLARDAPLLDLLTQYLAYEGHPPLWYLLLAAPAKAGLPYSALKVVAGVIGAIGVYLLLFRLSAVPLLLRALIPFTFFFAFQYTVVSRSYVLLPPILFAVAMIDRQRAGRFPLFVALLILLSNTTIYGFGLAWALAVLFAADAFHGKIDLAAAKRSTLIIGTIAFALNTVLLILMLLPPADLQSKDVLHSPLNLPRVSGLASLIVQEMLWGEPTAPPLLAAVIAAAVYLAYAIIIWWMFRAGTVGAYALLSLATLFVAAIYYSPWHEGIFFLVLLFGMALTFVRLSPQKRSAPLTRLVIVVFALILLRHIQWTVMSLAYDSRNPWTGSAAAARYIRDHHLDEAELFGAGLRTIEIQPYFSANVLDNYRFGGLTFWTWSSANPFPYPRTSIESQSEMATWYRRLLAQKPRYVLAAIGFRDDQSYAQALRRNGDYRLMAEFPGQSYWKMGKGEVIAFELFERLSPKKAKGR
jgi:hypothetical protein